MKNVPVNMSACKVGFRFICRRIIILEVLVCVYILCPLCYSQRVKVPFLHTSREMKMFAVSL